LQQALACGYGHLCRLRCLRLHASITDASFVQRRTSRGNLAISRADCAAQRFGSLLRCHNGLLSLRQGLLCLPRLATQRPAGVAPHSLTVARVQ
jgi:hypothetical protein